MAGTRPAYAGGVILALDVATRTGAAWGVPGGTPILQSLDWRQDDSEDVPALCGRAVARMARFMRDNRPDAVVIEMPIAPAALKGRTTNDTTMTLLPLYGVFCGLVMAKQIPLIPVQISTWRKYALGIGNLKSKDATVGPHSRKPEETQARFERLLRARISNYSAAVR